MKYCSTQLEPQQKLVWQFPTSAHWTGAPTNPPKKVGLRQMTLHFYVINAKMFSSDLLKTYDNFSLSYIRWGLVGAMVYSGSSRRIRKKPNVSLWVMFSEVS